jgi:hypothetical protein
MPQHVNAPITPGTCPLPISTERISSRHLLYKAAATILRNISTQIFTM